MPRWALLKACIALALLLLLFFNYYINPNLETKSSEFADALQKQFTGLWFACDMQKVDNIFYTETSFDLGLRKPTV